MPCGVDRIAQRSKMHVPGRQILDYFEQMADGARQAIEAHNDGGIAGADLPPQLRQGRARAGDAGAVPQHDRLAAGRAKLHFLRFGRLLVGRGARVSPTPATILIIFSVR
jgi:hypothetical protein